MWVMALVPDKKFSTFTDGGGLTTGDIVVGLRNGFNTKFSWTASNIVTSAIGTPNQILVNGTSVTPESGALILSLPQSIAPSSSPTFAGMTLGSPLPITSGGTGNNASSPYALVVGNPGATQLIPLDKGSTGQLLQSNGSGGFPTWTTATYPSIIDHNQLLFTQVDNVIIGLASANSSVLQSSSGGEPQWTQTLPSAVQSNITQTGTITSGTWNATPLDVPHGGTGVSAIDPYAVVCGGVSSTTNIQTVLSVGTVGQALVSNGPGTLPSFQTLGNSAVPVGTVIDFAGTALPSDYLICDGTTRDTTTFATLFAVIGYTWGGSGANFALPNLQGNVTVGTNGPAPFNVGSGPTVIGASTNNIALVNQNMPSGVGWAPPSGGGSGPQNRSCPTGSSLNVWASAPGIGGQPFQAGVSQPIPVSTVQPTIALLKLIRYQ